MDNSLGGARCTMIIHFNTKKNPDVKLRTDAHFFVGIKLISRTVHKKILETLRRSEDEESLNWDVTTDVMDKIDVNKITFNVHTTYNNNIVSDVRLLTNNDMRKIIENTKNTPSYKGYKRYLYENDIGFRIGKRFEEITDKERIDDILSTKYDRLKYKNIVVLNNTLVDTDHINDMRMKIISDDVRINTDKTGDNVNRIESLEKNVFSDKEIPSRNYEYIDYQAENNRYYADIAEALGGKDYYDRVMNKPKIDRRSELGKIRNELDKNLDTQKMQMVDNELT